MNHRGWIVLESVVSGDGQLCVDFFERPGGGYGFEHFRADPEDQGRWTVVGHLGGLVFDSAEEAVAAAVDEVAWLTSDPRAARALHDWRSHFPG